MRPLLPRAVVRRLVLSAVLAPLGAALSLMSTTKVRKLWRGKNAAPLPRVAPDEFTLDGGTTATVHTSGATLYDDMLAAIDGATTRVLLASYIVKADATGRRFKRALEDAAARGVAVHVLYDGFANLVVRPSFFRFAPGVAVMRHPILPRTWRLLSPRAWGRDHRKILVVDDTVGFVGGYNVGELYATEWRDTHLAVTGTAVWDLENAFVDFWNMMAPGRPLKPLSSPSWDPHVRAHRNVPRQLVFPIRGMYLEAIDRATESIEITQAYFVPDRDIEDALIEAARRGVRVRILLPRVSNHVVADFVSRIHFDRLLDAGIEILRYRDHMVHAKTMTIDGAWSTIGTANIDRLSLTGNYEINLELLDDKLARGMQQVFERDALRAEVLDPDEWRARPRLARVYERVLQAWRPLV
jgi:cardiolipin synthase